MNVIKPAVQNKIQKLDYTQIVEQLCGSSRDLIANFKYFYKSAQNLKRKRTFTKDKKMWDCGMLLVIMERWREEIDANFQGARFSTFFF